MNNTELQILVEKISVEVFHKPFKHKAIFNNRLQSTGGRYFLNTHQIEINPKQLETYGVEAVVSIIKHELCHYHLHIEGRGYKHQHTDFKALSAETGAPRYCSPVPRKQELCYKCINCNQLYIRERRVNIKKYRCGKCRGKLELVSS